MKLDHIPLDRLCVSKANMRDGKRAPDLDDILPSIRARGVLVPVLVRPNCQDGHFEIVAGRRRFHAAVIVANETGEAEPMPCAILDDGDDAAALEASLIENIARRDPDAVTQWETFAALVKQGRGLEDLSATFGLPMLDVKRILALGNLLPRIRSLYKGGEVDRSTIRQLTMASKAQQKAWLALHDDPDARCPTGHQLKAWLFGGAEIATGIALFALESYTGTIVGDLFGEDRYFGDADAFWTAQEAAIAARAEQYRTAGWSDVVVLPRGDYFAKYEHAAASKRKGGRIYITVSRRGEVDFHEGFLTLKEARRIAGGEADAPKPARPELSGPLTTYVDLHRHAAVRAALTFHPHLALRAMVAHAIAGSAYWNVRAEPQAARNDATTESVENSRAEAAFDERRRAVLEVLGADPDTPRVIDGIDAGGAAGILLRLIELPDTAVLDVIAIVMGESLASGSAEVEVIGEEIGVGMATWWQADDALFALLRDKAVLGEIVREVAGDLVAHANKNEKAKTLKEIVVSHLNGADGRPKVEQWVPRWMQFPPSAYTARGGVGTVAAAETVRSLRAKAVSAAVDGAEHDGDTDQPVEVIDAGPGPEGADTGADTGTAGDEADRLAA